MQHMKIEIGERSFEYFINQRYEKKKVSRRS